MYNCRPQLNKSNGGIIKVRVCDDQAKQAESRIIALKELNFLQELPSLKRYLEMAIRKSPSDPICTVNKILLKSKDKPALELTNDMYDKGFQHSVYTFENVTLTLQVTSKPSLRSKSVSAEVDENSKATNVMRSPIQAGSFASTPGKFKSTPHSDGKFKHTGIGVMNSPSPGDFRSEKASLKPDSALKELRQDNVSAKSPDTVEQDRHDGIEEDAKTTEMNGTFTSPSPGKDNRNNKDMRKCDLDSSTEITPGREPVRVASVPIQKNIKESRVLSKKASIHSSASSSSLKSKGTSCNVSALSSAARKTAALRSNYLNGGTSGEATHQWMLGLRRNDDSKHVTKSKSAPKTGSRGVVDDSKGHGKSSKSKKDDGMLNDRMPLSDLFSASSASCKLNAEGRPSIETMTAQWEFMKSQFISGGDDHLNWLMVSKREGAREYAAQKHQAAEDSYFKYMHIINAEQERVNTLQASSSCGVPEILKAMHGCLPALTVNPYDVHASQKISECKEKLRKIFKLGTSEEMPGSFTQDVEDVVALDDKRRVAKKAGSFLLPRLNEGVKAMQDRLTHAQKQQEKALEEMEIWSRREKETNEYNDYIANEEKMWLEREKEPNMAALHTMRSYIPPNISELTVNDLIEASRTNGGLYSMELATEIQNNKLLHWLVMHQDDIAYANFLAGDKKAVFENIEVLDITEIRALACWIPKKFELDFDGKKNEWRKRLMARAKLLVSQSNGESVKGGWDEASNKRAMVTLPSLKDEQFRRSVYKYQTVNQFLARIKQYDEKEDLLTKKEKWFSAAQERAITSKKDFDEVLSESRDPEIKRCFSPSKLAAAKADARREWQNAEDNKKKLSDDVARLKKQIADAPISKVQYVESFEETKNFLSDIGKEFDEQSEPVLIEGVFSPVVDIVRTKRAEHKFLSPEEEALLRKKEITTIKERGDNVGVESESQKEVTQESSIVVPKESTKMSEDDSPLSKDAGGANDFERTPNAPTGNESDDKMSTTTRKKVLANANPEMLSKLNAMFMSPNPNIPLSTSCSWRGKGDKKATPIPGDSLVGDKTTPKVKATDTPMSTKSAKSKFLKRYLDAEAPSGGVSPTPSSGIGAKPALSFLDQIKNRNGGGVSSSSSNEIKGNTLSGCNEESAPTLPAALSFLESIKARRKIE